MTNKKLAKPDFKTDIITPVFRLSYPNVFKAHRNEIAMNGVGRDQYDIVMMFDKKTAKVDLALMYALMKKVAECAFGAGAKGLLNPFKDGDTATTKAGELIKEKNPSYEGNMILNSWSKNRPGVVDAKQQTILDHDEIYGGCYCRAHLNCYAYDVVGNRGIAFGFLNLQKIKDGDPFGSRTKAEDAFTPVEETSLAEEATSELFS